MVVSSKINTAAMFYRSLLLAVHQPAVGLGWVLRFPINKPNRIEPVRSVVLPVPVRFLRAHLLDRGFDGQVRTEYNDSVPEPRKG